MDVVHLHFPAGYIVELSPGRHSKLGQQVSITFGID